MRPEGPKKFGGESAPPPLPPFPSPLPPTYLQVWIRRWTVRRKKPTRKWNLFSRRQNTLLKGFNTRVKLEKKDGLIKTKQFVIFCYCFFTVKKVVLNHRNLSLFEQRSISTISKWLWLGKWKVGGKPVSVGKAGLTIYKSLWLGTQKSVRGPYYRGPY